MTTAAHNQAIRDLVDPLMPVGFTVTSGEIPDLTEAPWLVLHGIVHFFKRSNLNGEHKHGVSTTYAVAAGRSRREVDEVMDLAEGALDQFPAVAGRVTISRLTQVGRQPASKQSDTPRIWQSTAQWTFLTAPE